MSGGVREWGCGMTESRKFLLCAKGEGRTKSWAGIDNDNPNFEGEKCRICMNAIIDRGVLDCCQHWFCFSCIDNWATITNLCPLCQNEFQMITCVPVYDTIGSRKADEDSTYSG
ncbi:hypothetical protein DVH24_004967 [Malus domestica]|uniref:RING-type domain-containing protein n=1 Tax=Malus domestica TaxID=3750 RepID=A0A498IIJ5_MALDO|nr:hypothetical protein DVH24_004967 [Malus domestica]